MIVAGRFLVEGLAGEGGMAQVYRARDRLDGRPVALKILRPQFRSEAARFAREACMLAELRHPGVVRYIAHGLFPDGDPFLAMEWLEGRDLAARLASAPLGVADTIRLGIRVAQALAFAHGRGVIHRDVKPNNIFLPDDAVDDARLLDFGIARWHRAGPASTQHGMMVGTPGYMAPEQARGEAGIDARADVFSLGCVLYECLTGVAAFAGDDAMALLARIVLDDVAPVATHCPEVPPALDALIARMLAKDPRQRPPEATAVASALLALTLPASSGERSRRTPPALTRQEQRLLTVALVGGAAGEDATTLRRARFVEPGRDTVEDARAPGPEALADAAQTAEIAALTALYGGRMERLADGSVAVLWAGSGAASDQATRAARAALALRGSRPGAPMALATGWGEVGAGPPLGCVIDRAVVLLRRGVPAASAVRVDDVTAGLLDGRFDVRDDGGGLVLRGALDRAEAPRTLRGTRPPCVGRERELAALEATLEQCVREPVARVVLVTGAPGLGKSRLRMELLARVARREGPVEVWKAYGDAMRAGAPYAMAGAAVRGIAGLLDGEAPELARHKLRARLARYLHGEDLDRVAVFLGELAGVGDPRETHVQLGAARRDPVLMADQVRRAWEELLALEVAATPVLLVLEDLHWGDLPSVRLVDGALRLLRDRAFMVLALARPEVHAQFPSLWVDRGREDIRLGVLTPRATERLVRAVLGAAVDAAVVARVVERAAGNPFCIEELVRAEAEGRSDAAPETVLAMVQASIDGLDGEARRLLRAASVFGQVFWRGGAGALLGVSPRARGLGELLAGLVERELLIARGEGRFPAEEEYVFAHALVAEAAYATLTADDRRLGHRLAAQWLEGVGEREALVLAEHHARGGDAARAGRWFRTAAEQALEANDFAAAIALGERGVACGAQGADLGELRLVQAISHRWGGEHAQAEARATEALGLLERGSSRWFAAVGEVVLPAARFGRGDRVEALGRMLLVLGEASSGAHRIALSRAVLQLCQLGRYEAARPLLERLEAIPDEALADDPLAAGRVYAARALWLRIAGDLGEALRWMERSLRSLERAGALRELTMQSVNLGFHFVDAGAFLQGELTLRDALANAERLGLPHAALMARQNLGLALERQGRLTEALELQGEVIASAQARGDARMEGGSRLYRASALRALGDCEAASRDAEAAATLLAGAAPLRAYALASWAAARLGEGILEEAVALASQALAILEELGGIDEGCAEVRLVHAEVLWAAGDMAGARRAITGARLALLASAAKIRDAVWRRSYLTQVPAHARTLALALEWLGE